MLLYTSEQFFPFFLLFVDSSAALFSLMGLTIYECSVRVMMGSIMHYGLQGPGVTQNITLCSLSTC